MRAKALGLLCAAGALGLAPPSATAATVQQDDFEDGDLTTATGPQGMTWKVVRGTATVGTVGGSKQLQLQAGDALVVSEQGLDLVEQTVQFKAQTTWSEPGQFVFLYKDAENFYWFGLGNKPGVFRRLAGQVQELYADANGRLRLPHAGAATNDFKVYVRREASKICFAIDRAGDGVDYDVELCDEDAAAVSAFAGAVAVGAAVQSTPDTRSKFSVDDVRVDDAKVVDPRPDRTFHVDAATGDDSRTVEQAQSAATPWKTIQKAAGVAFSGDTVLIAPGLYRETVVPAFSGRRDRPITYKAQDAAKKPILDGTSVPTGWQQVQTTDFKGGTHSAWRTTLDARPAAVFVGEGRMLPAQEPSQADPDDPFDLALFMPVPAASNPGTSHSELVDPTFLVQPADGYWSGGTLLLYDGFPNVVATGKITGYSAGTHTLSTEAFSNFIGSDRSKDDKYALRDHVGVLDVPGEYLVEGSAAPYTLTVLLPAGVDVSTVSVASRDVGFDFKSKKVEHVVVDGLDIRFFAKSGVDIGANVGIAVRGSALHHMQGDGLSASGADGVSVESCRVWANLNNGVSFGHGKNLAVRRCEITANGNNGIWVGSGTSQYFAAEHVVIQGNSITRHKGRRMHPDNFQMQQVRDIWLDGNLFIQEGEQNMWIQFCDDFRLTNNVFLGGTLGLNSTIHNFLFHNLFWKSSLRYDAHLTDAPVPGESDHYVPQQVVLRNNAFVESSITWPAAAVADRFAVFTVDHNYFNIENAHARSAWAWSGYRLGVLPGGGVLATAPSGAGGGYTYSLRATVVWSHPGKLLVAYRDAQNHYTIGLGNQPGIHRVLGGTATPIYDDKDGTLRLPHAGAATAVFTVEVSRSAAGIRLRVARDRTDGQWDVDVTDGDPAAIAAFADCGTAGAASAATTGTTVGLFVDDVSLKVGTSTFEDGFEDGDFTTSEGATGLVWTPTGAGGAVQTAGGTGVGFGEGSVVETDPTLRAAAFVKPPADATYASFDFHLLPTSPLRDKGLEEASVATDFDGNARFQGPAVDLGPYEYGDAPPVRPDAGTAAGEDAALPPETDAMTAASDGSQTSDVGSGPDGGANTGVDGGHRADSGAGPWAETGCSCATGGGRGGGLLLVLGALAFLAGRGQRSRVLTTSPRSSHPRRATQTP